jgi:hypothetical protein
MNNQTNAMESVCNKKIGQLNMVPIPKLEEHDSNPSNEGLHPNQVAVLTQFEGLLLEVESLMEL